MWVAPAARPASKYCMAGGMVAAGLEPTSRIACVSARSASGNGRPRSMPKARLPAVAAERHAEPAVVVDHGGAQGDPGELAEGVRLLVGQSAAAEAADPVAAVLLLGGDDPVGDQVEGGVPVGRAAAGCCGRPAPSAPAAAAAAAGDRAGSAAFHPLLHRPPRLVGKSSCGRRVAGRPPAVSTMPHCREQYGQCVRVSTEGMCPSWGFGVTSLAASCNGGLSFPHSGPVGRWRDG